MADQSKKSDEPMSDLDLAFALGTAIVESGRIPLELREKLCEDGVIDHLVPLIVEMMKRELGFSETGLRTPSALLNPKDVVRVRWQGDAFSFVGFLRQQLKLTHVDAGFDHWNFFDLPSDRTDRQIVLFESKTWKPCRPVTSEDVRAHFRDIGFTGRVAEYLMWAVTADMQPPHFSVSIPEPEDCYYKADSNHCFVPSYAFTITGMRSLGFMQLDDSRVWSSEYSFVGFRAWPR